MFNFKPSKSHINYSYTDFNEVLTDELLQIDTVGRDETYATKTRYPYQPTPYVILDKILSEKILENSRYLVDFGCGKGRVAFYFADKYVDIDITGIEAVKAFYADALKNLNGYKKKNSIHFLNKAAEDYFIPVQMDTFFFFRPFSVEIMHKVITNIFESYNKKKRNIRLIFYYLTEEYIMFLSSVPGINLINDIDCRNIIAKDDKKYRILVFEIK